MNFKYVTKLFFSAWLSMVMMSFLQALVAWYDLSLRAWNEDVRNQRLCRTWTFRDDNPQTCERTDANPPGLFTVHLIMRALRHVRWCGFNACDEIPSFRLASLFLLGLLVRKAPAATKFVKQRYAAHKQKRLEDRL